MFSMSDTHTPIEQYLGPMKPLSEAIQKIAHIRQENDLGWYYTFVAIDPFNTHIFTCPDNFTNPDKNKLTMHSEP